MYFKTLKNHVYDYIAEEISSGRLAAGERINEKDIQKRMGVSATPVREALIYLESYGYIENIPRKGFYVIELSDNDFKEKYQVIGQLEALAAELAMDMLEERDLDNMEKVIKLMDTYIEHHDFDRYFSIQHEFHDIFINKSQNQELIDTLERLKNSFIRRTYFEKESEEAITKTLKATNDEHREILKLFRKKDAQAVARYLREVHWDIRYSDTDEVLYY